MNDKLQNERAVRQVNPRAEPGQGPTWRALLLVLALVSFGVGHQWSKSRVGTQNNSPAGSEAVATANEAGAMGAPAPIVPQEEEIEVRDAVDLEAEAPAAPRAVETFSRLALHPPTPLLRAEPTPLVRQLMTSLTQLDFSQGPLSEEQAAHWKQGLLQLIQQGGAAVPAIQEFLELNRDWDLGAANPLGYPSLRTAFLEALEQIGGPEAQGLLLQTLQSTAVPSEIARVARSLERQAPGQFLEEIRTAVRETLAQSSAGQLTGWDMGPLFQVLQSHGSASVVPELEKYAAKWNYYSALALANLPSGAGVPALVQMAQESSEGGSRGAAMEALAQVAVQYPTASAALVELARSGKLSEKNWIAATSALEGNRYSIRDSGLDSASVPVGDGVKRYYLARSNQHFYSTPAWGGMSAEQIQQRLSIIDQLLAVSPSARVAQALENARASLLAKGQTVSAN